MKTVTLWKAYNPDQLFGGYSWHIEEVYDDWNHIYSEPYEVEIPEGFFIGESIVSEKMFFKQGCKRGYELTIMRNDCKNGNPYIVGGTPVETIRLRIVKKVEREEK